MWPEQVVMSKLVRTGVSLVCDYNACMHAVLCSHWSLVGSAPPLRFLSPVLVLLSPDSRGGILAVSQILITTQCRTLIICVLYTCFFQGRGILIYP